MEILTFLLLVCSVTVNAWKAGCPESVDIVPCSCTNSPFTYLRCTHLDDAEVLRRVFNNSHKYLYKEVHIEFSALEFLPREIFEKVTVIELHLHNVTLSKLFDKAPEDLKELDILHLENTKILRGFTWPLLGPLINLRILNVYFNSIRVLGHEISKYASKSLKQISFYDTQTKFIKPGVFKEFVELDKVAFDECKLEKISRNIFPIPFNVKYLYFNGNNIKSIPDDMFSFMPNLWTLSLRNNHISILPPSMFEGSPYVQKSGNLVLDGNPIVCDCRLAWLLQDRPRTLTGTCFVPTKFRGMELNSLSEHSSC